MFKPKIVSNIGACNEGWGIEGEGPWRALFLVVSHETAVVYVRLLPYPLPLSETESLESSCALCVLRCTKMELDSILQL